VGTRTGRFVSKLLMAPYTGGTPQIINDMMAKHIADAASY
jgi:hypothetical protein